MTSWKCWGLRILRRSHRGVRVPGHVFVCGTLCPWQYQNNTLLNTTQHSRAPSGIGSETEEIQPLIIPNVKSDSHREWEPYNICKPLGRWNVTYRHFSSKSYSPGNFPYDKNSLISDDGMLRFTGYRFIVKNLLKFLSWSPTWGFKSYLKEDGVLERRKWIDTLFCSETWRLWASPLRGHVMRVHKVQTLLSNLRNLYRNRVCPWKLKASLQWGEKGQAWTVRSEPGCFWEPSDLENT